MVEVWGWWWVQVNPESASCSRGAVQHLACVDSQGSQWLSHGWFLRKSRRIPPPFGVSRRPGAIGDVSCRSSLAETLLSPLARCLAATAALGAPPPADRLFLTPHRGLALATHPKLSCVRGFSLARVCFYLSLPSLPGLGFTRAGQTRNLVRARETPSPPKRSCK